jgi:SAM-dependent methyltransferase
LNKLKLYGREYFECGTISNYQGYEYHEGFDALAKALCKRFTPKTHLDVGCAKGFLVHAMRKRGVESWGVDISQYALQNPYHTVKGELVRVDVDCGLPFESQVFDLVTCVTTIEHLRKPEVFLQETKRVLKNGGRLFLVTDDPENPDALPFIQKDIAHVNVRNYSYWYGLLTRQKFSVRRTAFLECLAPRKPYLLNKAGRFGAISMSVLSRFGISQRFETAMNVYDQITHRALHIEIEATRRQR